MSYDHNNVFARILRGEIPCNKVYEDDHVLAFHDVVPARPVHVLVIPKGPYVSVSDMAADAKDTEIAALFRALERVADLTNIKTTGYRVIANTGEHGGRRFHTCISTFLGVWRSAPLSSEIQPLSRVVIYRLYPALGALRRMAFW